MDLCVFLYLPRQGAQGQCASLTTYVFLASSITSILRALPAFSNASSGRVASDVIGAATRLAGTICATAQNDVAAHAVVGIGLGAVDLGTSRQSVLGLGGSQSGSKDNGSGDGLHDYGRLLW